MNNNNNNNTETTTTNRDIYSLVYNLTLREYNECQSAIVGARSCYDWLVCLQVLLAYANNYVLAHAGAR